MSNFESIPEKLEEEYHAIKDDTPLVTVYTTGKVTMKWMLILDNLIINEILDTHEYKDYVEEFGGVEVLMIQPEPVESTQGTHRTPNPANVIQMTRKGTTAAGDTSSPRKSLKIHIKKQKLISTPIPPLSDDRECDEINEETLLSLADCVVIRIYQKQHFNGQCTRSDRSSVLLELMLLKRPKENTKCVSAADEELTAAKHKLKLWSSAVEVLMLLEERYCC
uniref:Uncharacterized protein n=1 Tax=Tanacetum cinerariifolium TaxID=118510 RepID=A0A699HFH3_TANCI|nr:hypothetical protein [Tanacetum cinerariifolium]